MSIEQSVSYWIAGIKRGDDEAVEQVWRRYYQRLVGLARRILESTPRQAMDEEDVALSAMNSFCAAALDGRFPCLGDRDELWKLLMTITIRKAFKVRRKEQAAPMKLSPEVISSLAGTDEPDHGFTVTFTDELRRLLERLDDPQLRTIVLLKLEGYTNKEIAGRFRRHETFVERKLRLIRRIWTDEP